MMRDSATAKGFVVGARRNAGKSMKMNFKYRVSHIHTCRSCSLFSWTRELCLFWRPLQCRLVLYGFATDTFSWSQDRSGLCGLHHLTPSLPKLLCIDNKAGS
ncbi:sodium/potassium-transporting ATPase subunit gamma isoform X1 [Notamacropus eugenii]|uniref:sodium/potassium-transporting ATPase subunit gamma isoform X1 n=1 Tax=Notamacropus eugenii TaxID=9315 RepID=UPI003B66E3CF